MLYAQSSSTALFIDRFMDNNYAMMDIEMSMEHLPGVELLVKINLRDSVRAEFYPPPKSPFWERKEKMLEKYSTLD